MPAFSTKPYLRHPSILGFMLVMSLLETPVDARIQFPHQRPDFFEQGRDRFQQEIERFRKPDKVPTLDIDIELSPWSAVLLQDGKAVVWMPQGMMVTKTHRVEGIGGEVEFDVISSTSGLGKFVIAFSDQDNSLATMEADDVLNQIRAHILNSQRGFDAIGDRSILFEDHPGREFILKNEAETITFQILLIQSRLYVMAVSQVTREKTETERINPPLNIVEIFFQSFDILGR